MTRGPSALLGGSLPVTEAGCVVVVQGLGGAGDYVVSSQIKDHALVFHKWGKTQPLFKVRGWAPITY